MNQRGQLVRVTDADDGITAYYYDNAGRKIAEVSPLNYDAGSTLQQMNRTEYSYDLMGRLKTKSYTYFDIITQQVVSYVSKAYKYDAGGNMIKELDALGYEEGTGYTTEAKINSGYGIEYTYDFANNNITTLDPVSDDRSLDYTILYEYDAIGRKVSQTDARGYVTEYTYDDAGNVLTISIESQTIQVNTYDLTGNLTGRTDGNGNTFTYTYNAMGKLKSTCLPGDASISSNITTYQYDMRGNLMMSSDTAGLVDEYIYDNQGRELIHIQHKSDNTQAITLSEISYDKAGNKRFVTDGNGVTTEYTYNDLNRLTASEVTVTDCNDDETVQTTSYGYDANGNQTTTTNWRGNTYTNVYDPINRLIEKINPYNVMMEGLIYNHNDVQIYSYDAYNYATQFTYDKNNRLLDKIDPLNHIESQSYDDAGNVCSKTDGRNKTTAYEYDEFNRLESVVNALDETTSYTYDLNGNMLTQTDGGGNVTTFEYNIRNKQTKKIDHGGRTGAPGNYTYDPERTETYTYYSDGQHAYKGRPQRCYDKLYL